MSYTSTHPPSQFNLVRDFFTRRTRTRRGGYRFREEFGWKAILLWPEKQAMNRPLRQPCDHVHRTETAALRCGQKAIGDPTAEPNRRFV